VLEDEQDEDETESDGADVHAADDVAAG